MNKYWTQEEINYLKENYGKIPTEKIVKKMIKEGLEIEDDESEEDFKERVLEAIDERKSEVLCGIQEVGYNGE